MSKPLHTHLLHFKLGLYKSMHLCHQHALSNQWVGKIIIHYSVIVFTFKYNKMCKVNLEKEQVTHESQADCLPLVRQMKQNSWTILSEKQGKVLSHFCLVLILKYWGSCQQFHDLLILGTLQFENSSSSYHGSRQQSSLLHYDKLQGWSGLCPPAHSWLSTLAFIIPLVTWSI